MKTSLPGSSPASAQQHGVSASNPMSLLGPRPPVANPFGALVKSKAIPPAVSFSDEEEKHSLFVSEENDEVKLMVASTPQLLDNYIKTKQPLVASTPGEAPFKEVMALVNIYNQVSSGFKKDLGKYLKQLMDKAVTEITSVGAGTGAEQFSFIPPPTQVVWGGTRGDGVDIVGTSMEANPLSINPGGFTGSEPGTPYKSGGAGYVKGHLLNHHLHGAASEQNLTPMRGRMNTAFEKNFESFLKQEVLSENKVYRFKVEAKNFIDVVPGLIEINAVELHLDGGSWVDNPEGFKISGTVNQAGGVNSTIKEETEETELPETSRDPGLLTGFINNNYEPYNEKLIELEKEYSSIQYEWSSEFGLYLKEIMQQIVTKLAAAFPETAAFFPKTQVTYGATKKFKNSDNPQNYHFKDEHGTSMHARLLSINPGDNHGYEPEGKRWGNLVQGHLLNHHLHGPAISKNLLPISNSLNTQMEKDIESVAKKMVLEENKVVSYKVQAAEDVTITEGQILLGKSTDGKADTEIPQTPNSALTGVEDAMLEVTPILEKETIPLDNFRKRKFATDSKEDKAQKRLKTAEENLDDEYHENIGKYENLEDYYVPSGIKAELQPLKIKPEVDTSHEANVDNPDNWVPDGALITYTGVNSLEQSANK